MIRYVLAVNVFLVQNRQWRRVPLPGVNLLCIRDYIADEHYNDRVDVTGTDFRVDLYF